uniref:KIB1-4 beta-propeller domain-containing protein n=1 Tax=Leersia perrieri TaxID=77586 RepID=A0A0D9V8Q6_9ORYZ
MDEDGKSRSTSTHAGDDDEHPPSSPFGPLPVLVYDHGFDPANNQQTMVRLATAAAGHTALNLETRVVPNLTNNNYHYVTPHGWVFIREAGTLPLLTRLWNPTSAGQPLPVNCKCYLSHEPTAASFIVLLLVVSEPRLIYCHVGAGDGNQWTSHEYDIGNVGLPPEYAPPRRRSIGETAAVDGKFYFSETGKLGILEFSEKGNRVYFMENVLSEPDGGSLCIYDLGDEKMEAMRPCPGVSELMCNPFWVMPTGT